MKIISKFRYSPVAIPLCLLILTAVSFGLLIPRLGYYWDDWAKILVSKVFGLQGYWAYYAEDRPLSGWTHILLTPLLGAAPLPWHIFTLIMRWLASWGMYGLVIRLWPARKLQAVMAACWFFVYPVFTQQPIALTFHQQWLQYALVFLSLILMIASVQHPRQYGWYTAASVLVTLVQLSVTEYFIGLEFLRPLIIWILLRNRQGNTRQTLKKALLFWLPYLLALAGYVVYRLFLNGLPDDPYQATTLYELFHAPLKTLGYLGRTVFVDLGYILVFVWSRVLDLGETANLPPLTWFSLAVGALTAVGLSVFLLGLKEDAPECDHPDDRFLPQVLLLGVLAVLCGPISAWATGRQVVFDFHSNRYALPAMLGASLLGVAAIEWAVTRRLAKVAVLSLLVGLVVAFHLRTANDFRWIWNSQLNFYWQLSWRAPSIEPGTAIIIENEPFPNQGLFSTSAALNLLYPQDADPTYLSYWLYTVYPRFAQNSPDLSNISFSSRFRTLAFRGSSDRALLVNYDLSKGGCLWMLNEIDQDNPYLDAAVLRMLPISDPGRQVSPAGQVGYPPADLFGREPERRWCYLFEKAELAVQQGDWQAVTALAQEAQSRGYNLTNSESNSPREWMPFLQAYLATGQDEAARQLTLENYQQDERYQKMLCTAWSKAGVEPPDEVCP